MDYERVVQTFRAGRVVAEVSLGQAKNGQWYYDTRVFRPFVDPGSTEPKRAYTFGHEDLRHAIDLAMRAECFITKQLDNQTTVTLGDKEAA